MLIAHATLDDAEAIAQVHVATWREAYAGLIPADYLAGLSVTQRMEIWRDVIAKQSSQVLIARENCEVLGFIDFGSSRDADALALTGEVRALYVVPSHWSGGVGRQLWWQAREKLQAQGYRAASLWVLARNERATRFYLSAGFVPDAAIKDVVIAGDSVRELRYITALET